MVRRAKHGASSSAAEPPHLCDDSSDDPGLDLDEDALSRAPQPQRRKVAHDWFPNGPCALEGVLMTLPTACTDIVAYAHLNGLTDVIASLIQVSTLGLVLTSSFSGTGAFEIACHIVYDELCAALGTHADARKGCVSWAATECDPIARVMLMNHTTATRPRHLFANVRDRLFDADRADLEEIVRSKLEAWDCARVSHEAGDIDDHALTTAKARQNIFLTCRKLPSSPHRPLGGLPRRRSLLPLPPSHLTAVVPTRPTSYPPPSHEGAAWHRDVGRAQEHVGDLRVQNALLLCHLPRRLPCVASV